MPDKKKETFTKEEAIIEDVPAPTDPTSGAENPAPTTKKTGITSHNYDRVSGGMTTDTGRFQN